MDHARGKTGESEVKLTIPEFVTGILFRPSQTIHRLLAQGIISSGAAWSLLVGWSAVEVVTWILAGDRHGGNVLKVLFIGEFVSARHHANLSFGQKFLFFLPGKIFCDLFLIVATHIMAKRRLGAETGSLADWFKLYCSLMGVLDVYFVFAALLALLPGDAATAMMASHVALAFCLAWNIHVFVKGFSAVYGLSDDRAFRSFFVSFMIVPASLLLLLVAFGVFQRLDTLLLD